MTLAAHRDALERKHRKLDREILDEELRPLPDSLRVGALKMQKLRIKDKIASL